jgi:four helix bundle suffix protein
MRFKAERCATPEQFRQWVKKETDEHRLAQPHKDLSVKVGESPCPSVQTLAANAALSLLNLACFLLDRQIAVQADAFEREGGFTERLYRVRQISRRSE